MSLLLENRTVVDRICRYASPRAAPERQSWLSTGCGLGFCRASRGRRFEGGGESSHIDGFCPRRGDLPPEAICCPRRRDPSLNTFLLDVRRFLREAAEARKIEKSRTLLTWPYRDALVDVSVMCEQAAAKPAHIEQKVWRSSGKAPAMALDAPQIGTPLASGVLGSAPNGVVRLM